MTGVLLRTSREDTGTQRHKRYCRRMQRLRRSDVAASQGMPESVPAPGSSERDMPQILL